MKFNYLVLAISALLASCSKDSQSGDDLIERNKVTKEEGEAFLAENRKAPGVVETYTGLQYKIDVLGNGEKPVLSDSLTLECVGKLPNGVVFLEKTERLLLSSQIEGLKQGLRYMPNGSVFTLYIPYYLAYDVSGRTFSHEGRRIDVGAYSAVVFECKLKDVKHNQ